MGDTAYRKEGDIGPGGIITLEDRDGATVDLTSLTTSDISIWIGKNEFTGSGVVITSITDPAQVQPVFASSSLEAGTYHVEVEVRFSPTVVTTFPENGYLKLKVVKDLG